VLCAFMRGASEGGAGAVAEVALAMGMSALSAVEDEEHEGSEKSEADDGAE